MGITTYTRAIIGEARHAQMDMPVTIVAASPGHVAARFSGSAQDPLSPDDLRTQVALALGKDAKDARPDDVLERTLAGARLKADALLDNSTMRFPAVVFIRLEGRPMTPHGQALHAVQDESWEKALRELHASGEGEFTLLILTLDVSR